MLVIRFQQIGKKHQPSFRIVVGERRSKLDGLQTEDLGWYDPKSKKSDIKKDREEYWLKVGAKASPTTHNLLVTTGIITGEKVPAHRMKKVKAAEGGAAPAATPAAEVKPAEPVKAEEPAQAGK